MSIDYDNKVIACMQGRRGSAIITENSDPQDFIYKVRMIGIHSTGTYYTNGLSDATSMAHFFTERGGSNEYRTT